MLYRAFKLKQTLDVVEAKQLMYASLIYMPLVLISYLF
jgi:hypothetical protein